MKNYTYYTTSFYYDKQGKAAFYEYATATYRNGERVNLFISDTIEDKKEFEQALISCQTQDGWSLESVFELSGGYKAMNYECTREHWN